MHKSTLAFHLITYTILAVSVSSFARAADPSSVELPRFVADAPDTAEASKPASIRFVTTDDFPPFNFIDGAGRLTGYNVELARAICARLALDCTIQVRAFPLLLDTILTNKADAVIAGMTDSPKLRKFAAYSQPYLRLPARFVIRKGAELSALPEGLAGRKVAVQAGSRYADFLSDFFPETLRSEVAGSDEALALLAAGEVEAAFDGAMAAAFWMAGPQAKGCCEFAPGAFVEPAYFGRGLSIAVARQNEGLKQLIDGQLAALEADGTLADLYLRFFPLPLY